MANSTPNEVTSDIYYCCDTTSSHDSYMCPYAHVTNVLDLIKIDVRRIVCSFDWDGTCKYKKSCMFAHLFDSESETDCDDEEEVVQEEPSIYLNSLNESVSTSEQSSENVDEHLAQHATSNSFELANSIVAISEQLEHVLSCDENQLSEKAEGCDIIPGPETTINESYAPGKESLENSDEDLETARHFPNETLSENYNGACLEPMVADTSLKVGDTSKQHSTLKPLEAIVTSIKYPESVTENQTNAVAQGGSAKENNIEVNSGTHLELRTTKESSVSQNSLLEVEVPAATSQPTNNVNVELDPIPTVSATQTCGICHEPIEPGRNYDRFGILPNCNHPFCLNCIKKWRDQGKECIIIEVDPSHELWDHSQSFDSLEEAQEAMGNSIDPNIARSCPVCRKLSYFVVPGCRWVINGAEKDELIASYKAKLGKIHCKYYSRAGKCRFNKSCFYLHSAIYCRVLRSKYNLG